MHFGEEIAQRTIELGKRHPRNENEVKAKQGYRMLEICFKTQPAKFLKKSVHFPNILSGNYFQTPIFRIIIYLYIILMLPFPLRNISSCSFGFS